MSYRFIKYIVSDTKKGVHIKLMYSMKGKIKRFSTGIFIVNLSKSNKNLIKKGIVKYNWFKEGDYDRLIKIGQELDQIVIDFFNTKGIKPTIYQLDEICNRDVHNEQTEMNTIFDLLQEYYNDKCHEFEKLDILKKHQRKKLERILNIKNTLKYYSETYLNRHIKLEELIQTDFWLDFLKFLLFNKPRKLEKNYEKPRHKLVHKGSSDFDINYGISNSTLDKWLKDLNTIINWCDSNNFILEKKNRIKKVQKEAVNKLSIKQHKNLEVALRKKEFDWLKTSKFEDHIVESIIDGKKVSKTSLIKTKDMFICMTILGCRFEDFSEFNEINIIQRSQRANKTMSRYEANINKTFLSLMNKHNYSFLISNQHFNKRIKEVFRQFYEYYMTMENVPESDLKYVVESHRGKYVNIKVLNKYEKIGAHTARRSFATMAYLDGGFPKEMVMKFTGHKSEREFDKYINLKIEEKDSEKLANFFD